MKPPQRIRVIAICVFRHGDKILVFEEYDTVKNSYYYRPLGGGVEFGETTGEAVKREIKEELGMEVGGLKLLDIVENIFTLEGKTGHEIVYVYEGHFTDPSVYEKDSFTGREDNGQSFKVVWRSLADFNDYRRLVPGKLSVLLKKGR